MSTGRRRPASPSLELGDFKNAADRVRPHVVRTPLRSAGPELWLKLENRQKTGSFKVRGALSKVLGLADDELQAGVVCASAGNHGLGVAYACSLRGAPCTVVVPAEAPEVKTGAIRSRGADLIAVPGGYGAAEARGRALAEKREAVWISPYNDLDVISGQGTIGLELAEQRSSAGERYRVYVPTSGGGLLCGIGLALAALGEPAEVVGVQAAAAPYLHTYFMGQDPAAVVETETLADGLAGPVEAGSVTFNLLADSCDEIQLVNESEIVEALRWLRWKGVVAEPSAAVGLACALREADEETTRVAIISGGNLDEGLARELLGEVR